MSTASSTVVQELVDAANAVHDAAKAMKNCKDDSRKISKVALDIAISIENTAAAAHHRDEAAGTAISVNAALGATRDVFVQCASFMRDVASKGPVRRYFAKGLTADTVGGYLGSVNGLHELLKIRDHECGVMLEPFSGLGIDETSNKDVLSANVKTINAAYDGLKSTISIMVNITDGLPWPLKAVPQTFLYILKLFESCQSVRPKITSLLFAVQNLWKAVEKVSPAVVADNADLRNHLSEFFETMQRIAIRLHIVLRVGHIKQAMATHTVSACLVLEEQRLAEAGKTIIAVFVVQTLNELKGLKGDVSRLLPVASVSPSDIDTSISTTLPPKPIVFHGRDMFISDAVRLLTSLNSARIAIIGPGGMGKTAIALAILYETRIVEHFQDRRLFLSCEALVDTNSVIISLAKLLGLSVSGDLLTAVVARMTDMPRVLLVLDNLETVWLVDGGPAASIEDLLGRLAQIPSLSIIITCRGIVLPQLVEWSNPDTAALEPFSLEAALETFQDRAGYRLTGPDEDITRELLTAVDNIPLAVTLLGQLARRGSPLSELMERWNSEHSALLRTHDVGRGNNAEVSIKLSITMVGTADSSGESLELLSVCCMLPDGLRPDVLKKMSVHFKHIYRARDTLTAYALASMSTDRALLTLSPVRHFVLENYPAWPTHREALHAIYFDIADRLPKKVDETFQELLAAAAPEMNNLSSLLLTIVRQPSQKIVDAVVSLTISANLHWPTLAVVSALLPNIESHPKWKADCLRIIGLGKGLLSDYLSALEAVNAAAELYVELGDRSLVATCSYIAGDAYRVLGDYKQAQKLLTEAREVHAELGDDIQEAKTRYALALVMRMMSDQSGASEQLTAARLTFDSLGEAYLAARCTKNLGVVHLDLGEVAAGIAQLEASRSIFISIGHQPQVLETTLWLVSAQRMHGELEMAEKHLEDVQLIYRTVGNLHGLANCAEQYGLLRVEQKRTEEALAQFQLASRISEKLQLQTKVRHCQYWINLLESDHGATV